MAKRRRAVIDSNVLFVANGKSPQANDACIERCIDTLQEVRDKKSLALDDNDEILDEYSHECNHSGQPGVGDEFYRWAFDSQYTNCQRVPLTSHEDRVYQEFPDSEALKNFDRSDRKFVATALGCTPTAIIYNAVDSDWTLSTSALAAAGVKVTELCSDCLRRVTA